VQKKHFYSKRAPARSTVNSEFQTVRMPVFLSPDEIIVLTGFVQASKQCEALKILGIPFTQNSSGKPVVLVAALVDLSKGVKLNVTSSPVQKGVSHGF
jgi:hypothetical protein